MAREILFDLGKMITDRIPYKLGLKRLTENDPEYTILDRACSNDEIAEVMLKMGLRKPKTTAEIAKLTGKSEERIVELLTDAAMHGIVEYNWENEKHEKQWYVQLFVPGIAEMTNMVLWQVEKYPELADAFDKMTFLPLEGKTHLIPPGGDGIGMHVLPVEKAIPAKNESMDIEHVSHWLDKYDMTASSPSATAPAATPAVCSTRAPARSRTTAASASATSPITWSRPARAARSPRKKLCRSASAPKRTVTSTRPRTSTARTRSSVCATATSASASRCAPASISTPPTSPPPPTAPTSTKRTASPAESASRSARPAPSSSARSSAPRTATSNIRSRSCPPA